MGRLGKPLAGLHFTLADLGKISAEDLLAIDGPKFITLNNENGVCTLAVLISHDKWRVLNHNLPDVDPHKAKQFFIGDQAYLVIPVERAIPGSTVWRPVRETGLDIITRKKKEISDDFGICSECGANVLDADTPMAHKSASGKIMPGHRKV